VWDLLFLGSHTLYFLCSLLFLLTLLLLFCYNRHTLPKLPEKEYMRNNLLKLLRWGEKWPKQCMHMWINE
jgi:hypothetical protein